MVASPESVPKAGAPEVTPRRICPLVPALVTPKPPAVLPNRSPFAVKVVCPVPPCPTDKAVVKPEREVISELAPLAAAPMPDLAVDCVVPPVPPLPTPKVPVTYTHLRAHETDSY